MANLSVIKCGKCGYEPNIITDVCLKCGTKLEKFCGNCSFGNSVEKNYCDQCGQIMSLRPPTGTNPKQDSGRHNPPPPPPGAPKPPEKPAPPEKPGFRLELQPIEATITEKDISFRRLMQGKGAPPDAGAVPGAGALNSPVIPPAAGSDRASKPSSKPGPKGDSGRMPRPGSKPGSKGDSGRLSQAGKPPLKLPGRPLSMTSLKKAGGVLVTVGLLGALVFILYLIADPHIPRIKLELTAKNYLKKLSAGRYEEAYDLLSSLSKSACTKADYAAHSREYYSKAPPWEFSGVEAVAIEQTGAMVKYQLREGTSPWRTEYISFVRERGEWARPYGMPLFGPIEAALAKPDYPQALFLAQKLALTDPMDPRAAGYLCMAEYSMNLYDRSVESCRKTTSAFMTFPDRFTPQQAFLFRVYYADSLRQTGKHAEALDEYDDLIKYPGVLARDQCPLFLHRADALVRLKKYDSAFYDIQKAEGACLDQRREEVQSKVRVMSGAAMQEAVALVQKTRLGPDQPPLAEQRKKELAAIAAALGPKNAKMAPTERWIPAHMAGPEYRVILKQEGVNPKTRQNYAKEVYIFVANLWTGAVGLEKNPSQ